MVLPMFIANRVPPVTPRRPIQSNLRRVHGVSADEDTTHSGPNERQSEPHDERPHRAPTSFTRAALTQELAETASRHLQDAIMDWLPPVSAALRGSAPASDAALDEDTGDGPDTERLRKLRDEVESVALRMGMPELDPAERRARVLDPALIARVDAELVTRMEAIAARHNHVTAATEPQQGRLLRRLSAVALATELLETLDMRGQLLQDMAEHQAPADSAPQLTARSGYGDALRATTSHHRIDRLM